LSGVCTRGGDTDSGHHVCLLKQGDSVDALKWERRRKLYVPGVRAAISKAGGRLTSGGVKGAALVTAT